MLDRFELTDGHLLGIETDNASSHYSIISELQSTLEDSGIERPTLSNHIPCMVHVIQLTLGEFISSLGVKGHTKSWEYHERNEQFGENESIDIGKSQRLPKEGNVRINKVSAMSPGLAKLIEKVHTSRYFETPETQIPEAENASFIDYANTWSSKRVHCMSTGQSPHRSTTDYGYEDMLELDTRVAWANLPITRIHLPVPPKSNIQ